MQAPSATSRALKLAFALVVAASTSSLVAQVDRGSIVGTVSDASGASVPGAQVTIKNLATDQSVKFTTDDSGKYAANVLRIGAYSVSVEKQGFKKAVEPSVEVGVNQVLRVDLSLQVGGANEVVEVTGVVPLLQTETSSLGTIETEKRISELPLNGRNFIQLAYLGPGANSGQTGSNVSGGVFENERANEALSVNGLRVSNNNFLLNGVDNNELTAGGDEPAQMRAQQVRSWRQRPQLEPPAAIGDRECARCAERRHHGADDGRALFVLNDALNGAWCERRKMRHRLNLRSALRACNRRGDTQKYQNADRRKRDHSGTTCHVHSGGPCPAAF